MPTFAQAEVGIAFKEQCGEVQEGDTLMEE